jgi:hypothetical protein
MTDSRNSNDNNRNSEYNRKRKMTRAELEGRKKSAPGHAPAKHGARPASAGQKPADRKDGKFRGKQSGRTMTDTAGKDGSSRASGTFRASGTSGKRFSSGRSRKPSFASVEADIEAMNRRAEEEEKKQAEIALSEPEAEEVPAGFDSLAIDEQILRATDEMGFEQMSPIQAQAIPVMLTGRDMIGQAQTGTGKTAAFAIPSSDEDRSEGPSSAGTDPVPHP